MKGETNLASIGSEAQSGMGTGEDRLRPDPILSVGISGHRRISAEALPLVERRLGEAFHALERALGAAAETDRGILSGRPPRLRVVSMCADGADLLAMRVGMGRRAELVAVVPSSVEAYADQIDPASRPVYEEVLAAASSTVQLRGSKGTRRFYERTNEAILDRADVLLAIWDGEEPRGRAGTAEVVQSALERGLPVVVIRPDGGTGAESLVDPSNHLLPSRATDLPRQSLDEGAWTALVRRAVGLGGRKSAKQLVADYFELPDRRPRRFEHKFFLYLSASRAARRRVQVKPWDAAEEAFRDLGAEPVALVRLRDLQERAARLAEHFGEHARSSMVLRSLAIAIFALITGVVGVALPDWSFVAVLVQGGATALILVESWLSKRGRWQARWLDQRLLAERLRCLRFLLPLGVSSRTIDLRNGPLQSADWLLLRLARTLEGSADFTPDAVKTWSEQIRSVELSGQIDYHRVAIRRLHLLERRLRMMATFSMASIVVAGAWSLAAMSIGLPRPGFASLLLAVGPAFVSSFNGLRAQYDIAHLKERSTRILPKLGSLSVALRHTEPAVDTLLIAATRAASIMLRESDEWRMTWNSRLGR